MCCDTYCCATRFGYTMDLPPSAVVSLLCCVWVGFAQPIASVSLAGGGGGWGQQQKQAALDQAFAERAALDDIAVEVPDMAREP